MNTGLDVLQAQDFAPLRGKRVGLMSNPSAVDRHLNSAYRIFADSPDVNLVALFGPEHGFASAAQDGVLVESGVDARTGLPVHSLYGENFRPTRDMLHNLDVLVCDIQDVGVRYYTFLWTISYILEAAGEYGVEVMVLDRPNPLSGQRIEGSPLEISSLVGRFNISIRHGMTLGELAQMINATWNPHPARLTVLPCEGWQRDMLWRDTGRVWVTPSPNIPHVVTALHYPGSCLIEGTSLSEGRGTALPFEIVGAPWVDGMALVDALNQQNHGGVIFRPHSFTPSQSKWAGEICYGVQAHLTNLTLWQPIQTWLQVLITLRQMYPEQFAWKPHFDLLMGSARVRESIEAGVSLGDIVQEWTDFNRRFEQQRQPFLLY
ncbi:MAG: DUF1343 domain-containing protein [Anaerolineae bacterium]|nr:DUF1343 domain-containing protein [Anaerolineae bacterium]